ncbi:protein PMR5 isoform X1 [Arachis duranensis]|uniref:Protein PMR5 isoform X1 n=1 Tax=Arachis duranensis TaxID=130453 RepID=A0A6P4B0N0_ARADU|nr:protein PMR5 isoform X1 [Arachis duranensis]
MAHMSSFFSLLLFLHFLVPFQCHVASSSSSSAKYHHNRNHSSACSLFEGSWVRDEEYPMPLYEYSRCPIIDPEFNCQMYGRPDSAYLTYRWKPLSCDLPRFNGIEFLMKMEGKTVMFVGDSLGRNQWQSLICMLSSAAPNARTQFLSGDPLSTFKFLDYGMSISFYRAPYLVDVDVFQGKRILRLEEVGRNGDAWKSADVLSFNTGHWWTHQGSLQGWDYVNLRGKYYQDMDRLAALEIGMKTWANWVDNNIDRSRTKVFFQAISPTHYNLSQLFISQHGLITYHVRRFAKRITSPMRRSPVPNEWNTRKTTTLMPTKNCYGETAPIRDTSSYPGPYPEQMRIVDMVIREMKNPAYLMDTTFLSALRKDGHPSIYSGELSPQQRANPDHSADCSHWCLPGLPDTWNELLYTALFY